MSSSSLPFLRSALLGLALVSTTNIIACSGTLDGDAIDDDEGDDPEASSSSAISSGSSRWSPPSSPSDGTYTGGGSWNGGRGCTGGMLPGTRALGSHITRDFGVKVDGYACRQNTANTSQVSMHGTGRALDIFGTGAKGKEIADWLVVNHKALGIQLVIYSRSKWNAANGPGAYSGPNPHTDHVHAELTAAAAKDASSASSSTTTTTTQTPAADEDNDNNNNDDDDETSDAPMFGKSCAGHGACNPGNNGAGLMCSNGKCIVGCASSVYCPGRQICSAGKCQ